MQGYPENVQFLNTTPLMEESIKGSIEHDLVGYCFSSKMNEKVHVQARYEIREGAPYMNMR